MKLGVPTSEKINAQVHNMSSKVWFNARVDHHSMGGKLNKTPIENLTLSRDTSKNWMLNEGL